jgi:hypothetical protein
VDIPTFIIPIKYWYAKDLFDSQLAQGGLFGAKEDILLLRRESVYYRSKHPSCGLKTPARILWYVTQSQDKQDNNMLSLKSIRACSRLDQIITGKPETLYKSFRRLGVFDRQQVLNIAKKKKNPNKEIMAIRFSDTEIFENPINLTEIKEIIPSLFLLSPKEILNDDFILIYNKGRNLI